MRLEKSAWCRKHLRMEPERLLGLDLGDGEGGEGWKHFRLRQQYTKLRPRDQKMEKSKDSGKSQQPCWLEV